MGRHSTGNKIVGATKAHYSPIVSMLRRKTLDKPKEVGGMKISFTDGEYKYSPGDTVNGIVEITNVEPIPSKALKVTCRGYCGVSPRRNDISWITEDEYFNSTVSMDDKGTDGTLNKGTHTFPFTFVIPATAPSSYFGDYGRIELEFQAFVDMPHFSKDYKAKTSVLVLKSLDLNDVPNIQDVNSSSVTKNFRYMLIKKGTIVLKATSDLRGYTPSQVIKIETEIQNRSGKSTSTVVASLIQKVSYKTKRPIHDLRTVAEVVGTGLKAMKEAKWKEEIVVPPMPFSTLQSSALMSIEYYIKVSLKSPDVSVTLPIFIGSTAVASAHRSDSVCPSAPLAELRHEAQEEGRQWAEEILTKSHTQPQRKGSCSPHSFVRIIDLQTFGSTNIFITPW